MKNLLTLFTAIIIFGLVEPALAERNITIDEIGRLMKILGFETGSFVNEFNRINKSLCNKTTEFNYKSPRLQSSNKQLTVYLDVVWRRQPQLNQASIDCAGTAKTTSASIAIVQGEQTEKIKVEVPHKNSEFIIYKPISFSKNLKYILFGRTHVTPEPDNEYVIFDLEKSTEKLIPLNCVFSEYRGFIAAEEAVFYCERLISSEGVATDKNVFTTFNLKGQKISRKSTLTKSNYYSYGNIQGEFSIIKTQVFKTRW